jgi:hypothetical protein
MYCTSHACAATLVGPTLGLRNNATAVTVTKITASAGKPTQVLQSPANRFRVSYPGWYETYMNKNPILLKTEQYFPVSQIITFVSKNGVVKSKESKCYLLEGMSERYLPICRFAAVILSQRTKQSRSRILNEGRSGHVISSFCRTVSTFTLRKGKITTNSSK